MFAPVRRNRRHNFDSVARATIADLNRIRGPRGTTARALIYDDVHGSSTSCPTCPTAARTEDHHAS